MHTTLSIKYDDSALDIMDKINKALEATSCQFVDDGQVHDGFCIYTLVQENRVDGG